MSGYRPDSRYRSGRDREYATSEDETAPQYLEYLKPGEANLDEDSPDEEAEYLPRGAPDPRWKWVAGIAAAVLAIAVIATAVVLDDGGDKPAIIAITTSVPPLTPVTTPPPPPSATTTAPETPSAPPTSTTTVEETPSTESTTESAPPEPPAPNPLLPQNGQIPINPNAFVYYIFGNQTPGDLLTITYTDGNGASHTVLGANLPWTMIVNPSADVSRGSITATSFASQVNCSISNSQQQVLSVQNNNSTIARCVK